MKICFWFAVTLLLLATLAPGGSQELTFKSSSSKVESFERSALGESLPVKVFEPHADIERTYLAIPLHGILNKVFGEAWRKPGAVLVFECLDGYRCIVETEKIQKHTAYLAYARQDDKPFEVYSKGQQQLAQLGPFYLIWDNLEDTAIRQVGSSLWPYQITTVELSLEGLETAAVEPPDGSSEEVLRGFEGFRRYCLTCHSINGRGGNKAPDLNYPANVTEYFEESWIYAMISDPHKVRLNSTMPPLNPTLPHRDQMIEDIIAYLKKMREKKIGDILEK